MDKIRLNGIIYLLSVRRFSVIVTHPSDDASEKRRFYIKFIGGAKNLSLAGFDLYIFSNIY